MKIIFTITYYGQIFDKYFRYKLITVTIIIEFNNQPLRDPWLTDARPAPLEEVPVRRDRVQA